MTTRLSRMGAVFAGAFLFLPAPVQGQQPQTCESVFGPGYTAHPDFTNVCCWPGRVPVPGEQRCVVPGQESAAPANPANAPPVNNRPGSNVQDAEGRPGAPGGHCIPSGATCTLGGAPCCSTGETCQGKFPNTYCQ